MAADHQGALHLLMRGPHGRAAPSAKSPTYLFFRGRADSGFASIIGEPSAPALSRHRGDWLRAFPPASNAAAVHLDRLTHPCLSSFAAQTVALVQRLGHLKLTAHLHLVAETLGSFDAISAAAACAKAGIGVASITLLAPFDTLEGAVAHPHIALSNLHALRALHAAGFTGRLHVIQTKETPHADAPAQHLVTRRPENLLRETQSLFGSPRVRHTQIAGAHHTANAKDLLSQTQTFLLMNGLPVEAIYGPPKQDDEDGPTGAPGGAADKGSRGR
jgi:hypothetical protein